MNLISEEKRKLFRDSCDFGCSTNDAFDEGIDFAENELQNLAIEFAEWMVERYFPSASVEGFYLSTDPRTITGFRIEDIFDKFINQRKV